jgi:hypothetical protein
MALSFPNACRSFDSKRKVIRFWGYDSALEISFLVEVSALYKLNPRTRNLEAGYLESFDAVRDKIFEAARNVYSREHQGTYLLTATDF